MNEKLYARRAPEDQGEHYWRHLDAMTREKLFDKCAIAAELAHRDIEIERLRAEVDRLQDVASLLVNYPDVAYWPKVGETDHAAGQAKVDYANEVLASVRELARKALAREAAESAKGQVTP